MCYAFAPPGILFDEGAAKFSEKYITSLVIGMDLVPRLSMRSVLHLRANVIKAIRSCKAPKYSVLTVGYNIAMCV